MARTTDFPETAFRPAQIHPRTGWPDPRITAWRVEDIQLLIAIGMEDVAWPFNILYIRAKPRKVRSSLRAHLSHTS